MTKQICEISASSCFYYKEICYDARSHEIKNKVTFHTVNSLPLKIFCCY